MSIAALVSGQLQRQRHVGIYGHPQIAVSGTTFSELLDARGCISHWKLNETSGSAFADRKGVAGLTATGPVQYIAAPIVNDGAATRCIGLAGSTSLRATNPVSKPWDGTAGAIGIVVQPDQAVAKVQLINRGTGAIAGAMSLETALNGQERGFRYDGAGTPVILLGTVGNIVAGNAYLRVLSWGPAGLKLYRNGTLVASDPTTNWAVDPAFNSDVFIGEWAAGGDGFDGCMSDAFILGTQPSDAQIATLALAISIAVAEDLDAGQVVQSTSTGINPKTLGWHGKAPIVPAIVSQGTLGNAVPSGELINYTASATPGTDDTFVARFTDANGKLSNDFTVTIDVIASGGGGGTFTGPTDLESAKTDDVWTSVGGQPIRSQTPL